MNTGACEARCRAFYRGNEARHSNCVVRETAARDRGTAVRSDGGTPQSKRANASLPGTPVRSERLCRMPDSGSKQLSAEEIYRMIREAAYLKAEARNFAPGVELNDWLEAEKEVMERLRASTTR